MCRNSKSSSGQSRFGRFWFRSSQSDISTASSPRSFDQDSTSTFSSPTLVNQSAGSIRSASNASSSSSVRIDEREEVRATEEVVAQWLASRRQRDQPA
ncbi:uncharacterized protein CC84DRAFT_1161893 [Paraphaeosphaeria sporulosa]|uniref:Uncharacterized protein n=1 Tax=Paraphaeosphaeria sporulosa TaxID=1460663 RepID=A0A177CKR2_9PLEO|nr:uncharacterized protein CC84DRAFT_1161893 [Paraphaeosphaeria sporulosa]OAG07821.1 hypothetical protein CC84DRAFT_1161893 [Paraphaeosphaeria sporulosa]